MVHWPSFDRLLVVTDPTGSLDALYFDVPIVTVYNSGGLPMEPFSLNLTVGGKKWGQPGGLPKAGRHLWPLQR